jgi:hypothetical protein
MEFIKGLMGCRFGPLGVDIIIYDILGCAGEAEEDAMIAVRVVLRWTGAGLFDCHGTTEGSNMSKVWDFSCKGFIRGLVDRVVVCAVI